MDPRSGEILAMANLRAGDGDTPPHPTPDNMAVTNVYEPGSVNKLITVAGALEEGVVKPDDAFVVPDHIEVANANFHDSSPHDTQRMTTVDIVAQSSNVGTIMIGKRLKKEGLDHYLRAFGLGSRTGLRFPGESPGLLPTDRDWSGTSIATVPIGQGMAVTALQMLLAYNVVANDGVYVAPTLVRSVVDAGGKRHVPSRPAGRRVVSIETARQVTAMLEEVVRAGTGKAAAVPGYRVAGKTGTAEKPRIGARGYEEGAYIATFAGFLPASDPRLSAIVVLDEPTPFYGGLSSAPVFAQLASFGARLVQVAPDRDVPLTPLPPQGSREPAPRVPTTLGPSQKQRTLPR
jgi:cell division protein FtsI (penicillin-binding protein 3)